MRTCQTCMCRCSGCVCDHCADDPPPPLAIDMVLDYAIECDACQVPICPFHSSETQRRHQLCAQCITRHSHRMHEYGIEYDSLDTSDSSSAEDGEWWEDDDEDEPWLLPSPPAKRAKIDAMEANRALRPSAAEPGATCSICLDDFTKGGGVALPCHASHVFHKPCIQTWLCSQSGTCPLCNTPTINNACPVYLFATASRTSSMDKPTTVPRSFSMRHQSPLRVNASTVACRAPTTATMS
jgi:hypothetical protein